MLHRLITTRRSARIVIRWISIKEPVWENLIRHRFLGPIRRMKIRAVNGQLERLCTTEFQSPRMARLVIITIFFGVIQDEFIAINAMFLWMQGNFPIIAAITAFLQCQRIFGLAAGGKIRIVFITTISGDFCLIKYCLYTSYFILAHSQPQSYRRTCLYRFKGYTVGLAPCVMHNLFF